MFPSTLLRYENPQKAVDRDTKTAIESILLKANKMVPITLLQLSTMSSTDILDAMLPPEVREKDGEYWYHKVSRAPASTSDIFRLQEHLDDELVRQEAREIGICPIRSELYQQCFEELTRQEIVSCPERGRLYRMVFLEMKLSLAAARRVYESALAYGIRKKLRSAREVSRMTEEISGLLERLAELDVRKQDLERSVPVTKDRCRAAEEAMQAELEAEESKLDKENEALKKQMLDSVEVYMELES